MSERFTLSPEHFSLVDRLVASGRFEGPQAVIAAALALLSDRERVRAQKLTELHAALTAEAGDTDATVLEIEHLMQSACAA